MSCAHAISTPSLAAMNLRLEKLQELSVPSRRTLASSASCGTSQLRCVDVQLLNGTPCVMGWHAAQRWTETHFVDFGQLTHYSGIRLISYAVSAGGPQIQ